MITIEYDRHGLAGVWSDHIDEDIWPQLTYLIGHDAPRYPVPAIPLTVTILPGSVSIHRANDEADLTFLSTNYGGIDALYTEY